MDTTIDDEPGGNRQRDACPQPVDTEAVQRGAGRGITLEGVEAQREGSDQADRMTAASHW